MIQRVMESERQLKSGVDRVLTVLECCQCCPMHVLNMYLFSLVIVIVLMMFSICIYRGR